MCIQFYDKLITNKILQQLYYNIRIKLLKTILHQILLHY